jgi:hypothetical protein
LCVLSIGGAGLLVAGDSPRGQSSAQDWSWTPARTPWGDPDLQGIWDSKTITPVQRPERFAGREFLTDEEVAELEREAAEHPGEAERAEAAAEALAQGVAPYMEDVVGSCLLSFNYSGRRVVRTKRTSLIVDPPDGRVPLLKKPAARVEPPAPPSVPAATPLDNSGPSDHPEQRPAIERCLGVSLPCLGGLCAFSRIVQAPGYVTIYYEQGHGGGAYRTIPLDGRPHLPRQVRQWLGDSVGRWDGDSLVVDTANFTRQTSFRGSRDGLHLTERFTRAGPDLIFYRITVEDPTVFARPWTLELTLSKADDRRNQIFETACHEGNHSLTYSLSGARAVDRQAPGVAPWSSARAEPASSRPRVGSARPAHFHHLHLNSVNPAAAIQYYARAFPDVTPMTTAGFEGFRTTSRLATEPGNVVILFSKVDTPPRTEPQSAIWHFGWNSTDARAALERYRALKLRIESMFADHDGTRIDISSDALPGYLTKEQIAEARARGVKPARVGGFLYLRGPDDALVEAFGDFPAERFTHVHMYHRDPVCAQRWYARHLGATVAASHLHLGSEFSGPRATPALNDCRRPYKAPTYPAFPREGVVRDPDGYVLFDDIGLPIRPYADPLASTRNQTVDHLALGVTDLPGTLARLQRDGVKVLEAIGPWGETRAAMIEGPDHVAIELVEEQ